MTVTKVTLDSFTPKADGTCAEASVVLDNSLVIHKVFVVNGEKGYFVAMPNTGQTKIFGSKKRYDDLVHPIDNSLSKEIDSAVLSAFYNRAGVLKSDEKMSE